MQKYIDVVQDRYGRAVEGASVYIYATGTFNAATLYSDEGVTPKSNPLTTDANGEFSFYAADGDYDIRVVYGSTDVTKSDISLLAYDADLTTWAGITPGTGVATALGTNVGSAGSFVTNGGALGTPSSGTVTNLTGTASININGTVGATTPAAGTFTTLNATGGGALTGTWTNLGSVTTIDINGGTIDGTNIGATTPGTGAFTTLSATGNVTLGDAATDTVTVNGYISSKVLVGENAPALTSGTLVSESDATTSAFDDASVLSIKNRDATTNNTSDIGFYDSASVVTGGISAKYTDHSNHYSNISIYTRGSGGFGERLVVGSSGNVGIGVTPTARNNTTLQIKDGIGFPATQVASTDANTLDDYEEGTWTPTALGDVTAGIGTYSLQVGSYTKIGRLVTCYFTVIWSAHTGSGDIRISGLPFTAANQSTFHAAACNGYTITGQPLLEVFANNSYCKVYAQNNGTLSNLALDTAAEFYGTVSYFV